MLCCCVIRYCVQSWVMFGRQSDFNVFYAQYQAALRHIKSGEWCVRTHAKCLLALWLSRCVCVMCAYVCVCGGRPHHRFPEVNMFSGKVSWPVFSSLQAFWPGMQVLVGDVNAAGEAAQGFAKLWRMWGFVPERLHVVDMELLDPQVRLRVCVGVGSVSSGAAVDATCAAVPASTGATGIGVLPVSSHARLVLVGAGRGGSAVAENPLPNAVRLR